MIERWATRYLEIWRSKGEVNARAWSKTFLNEDDIPRIREKLEEMKGKGRR
jgi:hypothetical protein